jgi:hypothetical protein
MAARRAASLQNGGDPTLEEEDARRPSREREILVGKRTRIINRIKAALVRPGIRGFKPGLLMAPQKLDALRTPEETPRPAENVVGFYNKRGTCEQWIREGKGAVRWTRLSCRSFAANAVRHTLATPEPIKDWSLTSVKGAKLVSHGRYVAFQMAEVTIPRNLFADILRLVAELWPAPVT